MNDVILSGRLGEKPVVKKVSLEGKGEMAVTNVGIYLFDPSGEEDEEGRKKGILMHIAAWGINAEILSAKSRGDVVTLMGKFRSKTDEKTGKRQMYVTVTKIDPTNQIAAEFAQLAKEYNAGTIEKIYHIEDY